MNIHNTKQTEIVMVSLSRYIKNKKVTFSSFYLLTTFAFVSQEFGKTEPEQVNYRYSERNPTPGLYESVHFKGNFPSNFTFGK